MEGKLKLNNRVEGDQGKIKNHIKIISKIIITKIYKSYIFFHKTFLQY